MAIPFPKLLGRRGQDALDDDQVANLRRLLETPVVQEALAADASAIQSRRVQLVADLQKISRESESRSRELSKAAETQHKAANRLKEQLREAEEALNVIVRQIFSEPARTGAQAQPIENELRELAPKAIDDFVEELTEYRAKLQRMDPIDARIGGVYNASQSIARSLETLGLLFAEARALKISPLSDAQIEERLAQLRAELPALLKVEAFLEPAFRDGHEVRRA